MAANIARQVVLWSALVFAACGGDDNDADDRSQGSSSLPQATLDKLVAHHGLRLFAPENSIQAFELAQARGYGKIELDTLATGDGQFVAFHDLDLSLVFDDPTEVCALNVPQLQARALAPYFLKTTFDLEAPVATSLAQVPDPWLQQLQAARIPTVRQVFERFGSSVLYILDVKTLSCSEANEAGIAAMIALIDEFDLRQNVMLESGDAELLSVIETALSAERGKVGQEVFSFTRAEPFTEATVQSADEIPELAEEVDFLISELDLFSNPQKDRYSFFNGQTSLVKICPSADTACIAAASGLTQVEQGENLLFVDPRFAGAFQNSG